MKNLTLSLKSSGGRNVYGRITSFHRGGGHKKRYRLIDFTRKLQHLPAIVRTVEKDPIRTAFISLICYKSGNLSYIITAENLKIGDVLLSNDRDAVMTGSSMRLEHIPLGSFIHNVEYNNESKIARAAGTYAQILKKTFTHALIKIPSNKKIMVNLKNYATIGKVSNPQHIYQKILKAGKSRWKGITPTVRGVAMNPIDHPMGGKTHGKVHRTPWGYVTKGPKTRKIKK